MDFSQNHADIAWRNFLAQYGESPKLESVVRALYSPMQQMQDSLRQLYDERWLDTASGAQLDGIGQIVGQTRDIPDTVSVTFFGFSNQDDVAGFGGARLRRQEEDTSSGGTTRLLDAEYRKVLYWKIAANNGHGTAPEIAAAVRAIFDASVVRVRDMGNAKIGVWFNTTPQTNPVMLADPLRWVPAAAGVGLELLSNTDDRPFGFSIQGLFGFGVGRMTSRIS